MLYQIICLMDTPPVTEEEQHLCLHSPTRCWRLESAQRRNGRNGHERTAGREKCCGDECGREEIGVEAAANGRGKAGGKPREAARAAKTE